MTLIVDRPPPGGWPRAEWLAARKDRIGASDVAAIVGWSRFQSPHGLYLEKIGLIEPDDAGRDETAALGQILEPTILGLYEHDTDLTVIERQSMAYDDTRPWLRCTLDGVAVENVDASEGEPPPAPLASALSIVEAKRPIDWAWHDVPREYQLQVQTQMGVTGIHHAVVAALHPAAFRTYEIEFDPAVFARIVEWCEEFRARLVDRRPPPVDNHRATGPAIKAAYNAARAQAGATVELDDEHLALAAKWLRAKAEASRAEADRDRLENELRALLGTATAAERDGLPYVTWNPQPAGGKEPFDIDLCKEQYPEAYMACRGLRGQTRVLRATRWLRDLQESANAL